MVPVNRATEHVHSPWPNSTLYGSLPTWLSGNVLKNSIDSARCAGPPRVGSGCPGQYTTTFSAWRLSNVSQSCAFQASSNVFIKRMFSSTLFIAVLIGRPPISYLTDAQCGPCNRVAGAAHRDVIIALHRPKSVPVRGRIPRADDQAARAVGHVQCDGPGDACAGVASRSQSSWSHPSLLEHFWDDA